MFRQFKFNYIYRRFNATVGAETQSKNKYLKVAGKIRVGLFQRMRQIGVKYRNFFIFSAMLQIVAMVTQDNQDLNKRYTLMMEKYDDIMEEANKYGPDFWGTFDLEKELLPLKHLFDENEERKNVFRWYFKINNFIQNTKEKNRQAEEYKKQLMEQENDEALKLEKKTTLYNQENENLWKEFLADVEGDATKQENKPAKEEYQLTKSELQSGERLPQQIKDLMAKEKELKTYYYDAPIVRVDNGESGNYAEAPKAVNSEIKTFV